MVGVSEKHQLFSKGSEVEVSSDEEGFKGAWYVAKILELPKSKSYPSKKNHNHHYLVEYQRLVANRRGTKPLKEYIPPSFVRPLPPPTEDVDFEVGDVVDALYRDGWWAGVIRSIAKNSRFRVYFNNPPEEVDFDRSQLRVHQEWVDGNWVRPKKQRTTGFNFSVGAAVEVNLDKGDSCDVWWPAIVWKLIDKNSFLVKVHSPRNGDGACLEYTVDSLHIRPCPPDLLREDFELLEKVDGFFEFGWCNGVITKVLEARRFTVFFKHINKEVNFNPSELRLHMDWTDGKWLKGSQEVIASEQSRRSRNNGMVIQHESSDAAKSCAEEKLTSSPGPVKDQVDKSSSCNEKSPSATTLSKKKTKRTEDNIDATLSQPSKKLKEGNVVEAPLSPTVCQPAMIPIEPLAQEALPSSATPITGESGNSFSKQSANGDRSSARTKSRFSGTKFETKQQKDSPPVNQKTDFVKGRRGRPRKSLADSPPITAPGKDGNTEEPEMPIVMGLEVSDGMKSAQAEDDDDAGEMGSPQAKADAEGTKRARAKDDAVGTKRARAKDDTERTKHSQDDAEEMKGAQAKDDAERAKSVQDKDDAEGVKSAGDKDDAEGVKSAQDKDYAEGMKSAWDKDDAEGAKSVWDKDGAEGAKSALDKDVEGAKSVRDEEGMKSAQAKDEGEGLRSAQAKDQSEEISLQARDSSQHLNEESSELLRDEEELARPHNMRFRHQKEVGVKTQIKRRGRPRKLVIETPKASAAGEENNAVGAADVKVVQNSMSNGVEGPASKVVEPSSMRGQKKVSNDPARRKSIIPNTISKMPLLKKEKVPNETIAQVSGKQFEWRTSKRGRKRSMSINKSKDASGEISTEICMTREDEMASGEVSNNLNEDDRPLSLLFKGMHSPTTVEEPRFPPGLNIEAQLKDASTPQSTPNAASKIQSSPFIKSSPVWKTIESMDVFKIMPQKPHFGPLDKCKEGCREGLAIGNMVTFASLVEKVSKLSFDEPRSIINSSLETVSDLETHGFDIKAVRGRLLDLLMVKEKQEKLQNQSREAERKIKEHSQNKIKLDEEVEEIDKKIKELQEQRKQAILTRERKDAEIATLRSNLSVIDQDIRGIQADFEKLVDAPW